MFPFSWSFRDWGRACLVFASGVILGMAIWWTSPMLTGHIEPWDVPGKFYPGMLFAAGFVAAAFLPKAFWVAPIGVYVGQLLYTVYLFDPHDGALWPLGMIIAVIYCAAALAGAASCAVFLGLTGMLLAILRFLVGWWRPIKKPG
jgi:hypothetical protein